MPSRKRSIYWVDESDVLDRLKYYLDRKELNLKKISEKLDMLNVNSDNVKAFIAEGYQTPTELSWLRLFFFKAHMQATQKCYNNNQRELFKAIITKFMLINYSITNAMFVKTAIRLPGNVRYHSQLSKDFDNVSAEFGIKEIELALLHQDLVRLMDAVTSIEHNVLQKWIQDTANDVDSEMIKTFFMLAHKDVTEEDYKTGRFEWTLARFFSCDFVKTRKAFYEVSKMLKVNNDEGFSQLMKDMYKTLEDDFAAIIRDPLDLIRSGYTEAITSSEESDSTNDSNNINDSDNDRSEEESKSADSSILSEESNQSTSQRSVEPVVVQLEQKAMNSDDDSKQDTQTKAGIFDVSISHPFEWVEALSEALQQYFLKTAPIIAFEEEQGHLAKMYGYTPAVDFFTERNYSRAESSSAEFNLYEQAKILCQDPIDAIDTNMVYKDQAVTSIILPTNIELGSNFVGEWVFSGMGLVI